VVKKKEYTMQYAEKFSSGFAEKTIENKETSSKRKSVFTSNEEVIQLARWCYLIEKHYDKPMDIEWAKDGLINRSILFRQDQRRFTIQKKENRQAKIYFKQRKVLVSGIVLGGAIASGKSTPLLSPKEGLKRKEKFLSPILPQSRLGSHSEKQALLSPTKEVERHAAIVARELNCSRCRLW
jgi:pyruvate,water dikinase